MSFPHCSTLIWEVSSSRTATTTRKRRYISTMFFPICIIATIYYYPITIGAFSTIPTDPYRIKGSDKSTTFRPRQLHLNLSASLSDQTSITSNNNRRRIPTSKRRRRRPKKSKRNSDSNTIFAANPIPVLPLTNEQNVMNKNNLDQVKESSHGNDDIYSDEATIINYPSLPSPGRRTTKTIKIKASRSSTLLKKGRRRGKGSNSLLSTESARLTRDEEISLTQAIRTMKSMIRIRDELSLKLDEIRNRCDDNINSDEFDEECEIDDSLSTTHQRRKRQWKVNGYLSSLSQRNSNNQWMVNDYLSSLESNDADLRRGQMSEWTRTNDYLSSLSSGYYSSDSHLQEHMMNPMYRAASSSMYADGESSSDFGIAGHCEYKSEPTEEEWADACDVSPLQLRRALVSGREARSKLVSANIGLVTNIAKRYHHELQKSLGGFSVGNNSRNRQGVNADNARSNNVHNGVGSNTGGSTGTILTLHDFIQEGNLGLMEAAERYDSTKGARFGTYAAYWVRQRILSCIASDSRVIRLPAHVHSMLRTIRRARDEMEKEIGRPPSMPELAHHLNMPIDKLKLYTESSRSVLSLESQGNGHGSSLKSGSGEVDKRTLGELIASDTPTPFEDAESDALKQDIRAAIDALGNDRERDVLVIRFGLNDGNPKTLQETAHLLGISRDRVRSIESRALNKLRHPQRNYRLKDYFHDSNDQSPSKNENNGWENTQVTKRQHGRQNERHNVHSPPDRVFHGDALSKLSPEDIWSF